MNRSRTIRACAIALLLVGLACESGKDEGNGETGEQCESGANSSDLPKRINGVPEGFKALYAIVESGTGVPSTSTERMTQRKVTVVIDAFDQHGGKGTWIDTCPPADGVGPPLPVPKPYPKDTDERTRYQHPIYFQPGLIITASINATMFGAKDEWVACYFMMPGNETIERQTLQRRFITKVGPNGQGVAHAPCFVAGVR